MRKKYSQEYKQEAVHLAQSGDVPLSSIRTRQRTRGYRCWKRDTQAQPVFQAIVTAHNTSVA